MRAPLRGAATAPQSARQNPQAQGRGAGYWRAIPQVGSSSRARLEPAAVSHLGPARVRRLRLGRPRLRQLHLATLWGCLVRHLAQQGHQLVGVARCSGHLSGALDDRGGRARPPPRTRRQRPCLHPRGPQPRQCRRYHRPGDRPTGEQLAAAQHAGHCARNARANPGGDLSHHRDSPFGHSAVAAPIRGIVA